MAGSAWVEEGQTDRSTHNGRIGPLMNVIFLCARVHRAYVDSAQDNFMLFLAILNQKALRRYESAKSCMTT